MGTMTSMNVMYLHNNGLVQPCKTEREHFKRVVGRAQLLSADLSSQHLGDGEGGSGVQGHLRLCS